MKAIKSQKRERRHSRIRAKVLGNAERPRLSVFRSNKFIYAQIVDDETGKTLAASSDRAVKKTKNAGKVAGAKTVGMEIAKLAKEKNISKVVFDRGGYLYTGRVKAVSEGAREGGLSF
ncbi:MAG: 50S ribosomal protein L18 [Candidatus Paceibacterota bacterium]|jgi:large subunit ribosomal protein L18|nr:50S ribosomal protein L18 [Candidatus Paceibacterota bacterium]